MDNGDAIFIGILIGVLGAVIVFVIIFLTNVTPYIRISHETANELCNKVTGANNSIAKDWWDYPSDATPIIPKGGINCVIPTVDNTLNIQINAKGGG